MGLKSFDDRGDTEKGQTALLIGILADSHGRPDALRAGIEALRDRKADRLIHLGDVVDTLRLETVDECVRMLIENRIDGVLGNHEYSLVTHHFKRYTERFSKTTMNYVRSLPYLLEISDVCFTHFSPEGGVHGLYAATDEYSYEAILQNTAWPVLINGHSHEPHIYRRLDGAVESVEFDMGRPFMLMRGARYILTCGALEDLRCALFDLEARSFEVISVHD